jgi:trimeric autotransporter adhesin
MAILYVPEAYTTLQAAFAAAANGDTIVVSPIYTGPKGVATERLASVNLYIPARVTGVEVFLQYGRDRTVILTGDASVRIYGGDGNDTLIANAGDDYLHGGTGNDSLMGGDGDDELDGGWAGDDTLAGGRGNDILIGNTGNDTANYLDSTGTQGVTVDLTTGIATDNWGYTDSVAVDNVIGSNLDDRLTARSGDPEDAVLDGTADTILTGNGGNDVLYSNAGNDTLNGGDGNDLLTGGRGNEELIGGTGNDTAIYFATGTQGVAVDLTTGFATDNWGDSDTLEGIENVIGSNLNDNLTGGDGDTVLTGNGGIDTLYGNAGDDTLNGGDGNDVLAGGNGKDVLTGGAGLDTADYLDATGTRGVTVILPNRAATDNFGNVETISGIENVIGSNLADTLTGDHRANSLTGNDGNDTLNGGLGVDTMAGGLGNDMYYVDNSSDRAIEAGREGTDTVHTSVDYMLGANVESLWAHSGLIGLALTGNELANTLVGDAGNDRLFGGDGKDALTGASGNDILDGGLGADTMVGENDNDIYYVDNARDRTIEIENLDIDTVYASVDYTLGANVEKLRANAGSTGLTLKGNELFNTLVGGAGNDRLFGLAGGDFLDGGLGADTMAGGLKEDWYWVDNAGDRVIEAEGEGNDLVYASLDYTLTANVEALWANAGSTGLVLTGNELSNSMVGGAGNDTLNGVAGDDALTGQDGDDILDGGLGTDTMSGDFGNDTYYVDYSRDRAREAAGGGTDTVYAGVGYTLGDNVEILRANAGSTGLSLTGNKLANSLFGGAGKDRLFGLDGDDALDGELGADTMTGGLGNDTYYVDNAVDRTIEVVREGADKVYASVDYTLGDNVESLWGNAGSAGLALTGNTLANTLVGGAGNDILDGSAGSDTLRGGLGGDAFAFRTRLGKANVDMLADFVSGTDRIELARSIFTALDPGALSLAAFVHGAAATSADQRILYNAAAGVISYDADGNGGTSPVAFAVLNPGQTLTAGDFRVV